MPASRGKSSNGPTAGPPISLVTPNGLDCPVPADRVDEAADLWSYRTRNRRRWLDDAGTIGSLAEECHEFLKSLGLAEADLLKASSANSIEVRFNGVPPAVDASGVGRWLFPWEYVLSAAVQPAGDVRTLTVLRSLAAPGRASRRPPVKAAPKVLFVELAPGDLRAKTSFEVEAELVRHNLNLDAAMERLQDPSADELRSKVAAYQPEVIHLSGYHTQQARQEFHTVCQDAGDGWLFRGPGRAPAVVEAGKLAELLLAGDAKPALVCCNLWNSGATLCPMLVSGGAGSAVGFQDEFSDAPAESFFALLYQAWLKSKHNLPVAFPAAWSVLLAGRPNLRGSGMIVWTDAPVFARSARGAVRGDPGESVTLANEMMAAMREPRRSGDPIAKRLRIDVQPFVEFNYAVLHNGKSGLFRRFRLTVLDSGTIEGIEVTVTLNMGPESATFSGTFGVANTRDIKGEVYLPLTAALALGLRESVRSTLLVRVTCGDGPPLHHKTYHVSMLSVDEWSDTERHRPWLPSFVFPRDPLVAQVIAAAQKYLVALVDDPGAGFDGYQSLEVDEPRRSQAVDLQVRAIWASLTIDTPVSYINPPPTYTPLSQRLRRPSDIVRLRCGTCLDLALMLTACLEFVDIYPVLFLLRDHALVGYWSSVEAFRQFNIPNPAAAPDEVAVGHRGPETATQRFPWYFDLNEHYQEILKRVDAGDLVPIEATCLTRRQNFREALREGNEDLRDVRDFDAMIDVRRARGQNVTPLPIAWEDR